jgi:hypothetical protein
MARSVAENIIFYKRKLRHSAGLRMIKRVCHFVPEVKAD